MTEDQKLAEEYAESEGLRNLYYATDLRDAFLAGRESMRAQMKNYESALKEIFSANRACGKDQCDEVRYVIRKVEDRLTGAEVGK